MPGIQGSFSFCVPPRVLDDRGDKKIAVGGQVKTGFVIELHNRTREIILVEHYDFAAAAVA
jgi:hypothetical protein